MKNKDVINGLLEISAVELRAEKDNWFTWTSGIKSPIYCDNRLTMSYPELRKKIANAFVEIIKNKYPNVDIIAGTATAGIPHAAWVSEIMGLPMIYVREKAKGHGKTNQIEGKIFEGKNVVLVEDLISTGKSSINAAVALKEAGFNLMGVVSIFNYNLEKAITAFKEADIEFESITDYDTLIEMSKEQGKLTEDNIKNLIEWRNNL